MGEHNKKQRRSRRWRAAALRRLALMGALLAATALPAGVCAAEADAAPVRIAMNVDRVYAEPMETLLRRAYGALGLSVEFVHLPLLRSLSEMRAGRIDAASLRSDAFFEQNPEMLRVPVPLMNIEVYAFGRVPCPTTLGPDELNRHVVSYQRGSIVLENLTPPGGRRPVNTPSDALLNVANGVSDYALLHGTPALADLLQEAPLPQVCRVERPLSSARLYHALHPRLAGRLAPLAKVLAGMQERGEIDMAWAAFERQVVNQRLRLQVRPGRGMQLTPPGAAKEAGPARPPQ